MIQLSAVIITYNEEKNIARCLESLLGIADDIVVVDSFSTDATENICRNYKVNFIQRKWGGYSVTKNFANSLAKYDCVLSIDADECLSNELRQSILSMKNNASLNTCGFNRLTNYCGKWIWHCGWYPDYKIRIFDKRMSHWSGEIHEKLIINSSTPVLHLSGDCLHYSYYSIDQHERQIEKFSDIASAGLYKKGSAVTIFHQFLKPCFTFLKKYFLQLGFLDGRYGFVISKLSAYDVFLRYAKLRKLYKAQGKAK